MKDIYNNHKDIGLFNNGDYLVFSFKKTERIVSAIYLVTSLIKDSEPLKWELREASMSLISLIASLNGSESVDKNLMFQNYFSTSVQVMSFLTICNKSGHISEMNYSIIIKEIESLLNFLKEQSRIATHTAGYILSDSFFETDHVLSSQKPTVTGSSHIVKPLIKKDSINDIKDRKSSRKDSIISLLKKSSDLTIKDFVKVIPNCSEKTIQRELIDLVDSGVVVRKGERRWSTYSLV